MLYTDYIISYSFLIRLDLLYIFSLFKLYVFVHVAYFSIGFLFFSWLHGGAYWNQSSSYTCLGSHVDAGV